MMRYSLQSRDFFNLAIVKNEHDKKKPEERYIPLEET